MSQTTQGRWNLLLAAAVVLLPLAAWAVVPRLPAAGKLPAAYSGQSKYPASPRVFARQAIGPPAAVPARITNVQIADLDGDQQTDLIVCDARRQAVLWYQQQAHGWLEHVLAPGLIAPAHATVVDLDSDGDQDVLVAVLGNIFPDDSVVGRLVWLENQGDQRFVRRELLDDVRRVADVQPGDLDGDGDLDLAVAVFGYSRGQILWLENRGGGKFRDHLIDPAAPGVIHVPLADYDGDGDLDLATVISQDEEEIWGYENLGPGRGFARRQLHFSLNYDLGSAGLLQSDLDGDGDPDLIWPVGDNLEYKHAYPQPYHGCFWLENLGDWKFTAHRIADLGGTYAAATGDLDGDGDQDVALASLGNDWSQPGSASLVWLENDGRQQFTCHQLADAPIHLVTVACGDLNGDGVLDLATGALQVLKPGDRPAGVDIWLNQPAANAPANAPASGSPGSQREGRTSR